MKFAAIFQGEQIELEFDWTQAGVVEAKIAKRRYTVEIRMVEPGVYWFNWKNQSFEISVTPHGEQYFVSLPRGRVSVEMADARNALRRVTHHGVDGVAEIRTAMPGKVVKLLVAGGAEVRANQGLLVVEAMKMQNEVKSPKNGILRKLGVTEGAAVNSGDLLATIE